MPTDLRFHRSISPTWTCVDTSFSNEVSPETPRSEQANPSQGGDAKPRDPTGVSRVTERKGLKMGFRRNIALVALIGIISVLGISAPAIAGTDRGRCQQINRPGKLNCRSNRWCAKSSCRSSSKSPAPDSKTASTSIGSITETVAAPSGPTTETVVADTTQPSSSDTTGSITETVVTETTGPVTTETTATTESLEDPVVEMITPDLKIAYIYATDAAARDSFASLLDVGYDVTSVAMANLETHDFSDYELIIVGSDTGASSEWGTDAQLAHLAAASKPVIAIGNGGSSYFERLGLLVNYGQTWWANGTGAVASAVLDPLWEGVSLNVDGSVALYNNATDYLALFMPDGGLEGVTTKAGQIDDPLHFPIAEQTHNGDLHVLWGFLGSPSDMTPAGQRVFKNLVARMTI